MYVAVSDHKKVAGIIKKRASQDGGRTDLQKIALNRVRKANASLSMERAQL